MHFHQQKSQKFVQLYLLLNFQIITMNKRRGSTNEFSPFKSYHNNSMFHNVSVFHNKSVAFEQNVPKYKEGISKSGLKSNNSFHLKSSRKLSKSQNKSIKEEKENIKKNQLQTNNFTEKRFQQKLTIFFKIQELISQIQDRESKIKNYFQIYRILETEVGQQRCLQHNNDLSLYCQTQSKVLCVHCVYGDNKHKTHKVIPLKDSIRNVSKDIVLLQTKIKENLEVIRVKSKTCEMNQKFIEKYYHKEMEELEKRYFEKLKEIETDYQEKKQYMKDHFESLLKKTIQMTTTLKEFGKSVQFKTNILKNDNNQTHQDLKQISKQTILSKIAQISNMNGLKVQDIDQKDIGQNFLRSRVKLAKN